MTQDEFKLVSFISDKMREVDARLTERKDQLDEHLSTLYITRSTLRRVAADVVGGKLEQRDRDWLKTL